MSERPILFIDPMVRAILDGRKTQTRRVVKPSATEAALKSFHAPSGWYADRYNFGEEWCLWGEGGTPQHNKQGAWLGPCPYGVVGGTLWVREAWNCVSLPEQTIHGDFTDTMWLAGAIPVKRPASMQLAYRADGGWDDEPGARWRPSIHMPRWASRITLRITDVRVERLHDISEEDAKAEGVSPSGPFHRGVERADHVGGFMALWDTSNGSGAWDANPWVWALTFERVEAQREAA